MASVGLIVNPAASQDVRRLTSLARTVDVHERVNTVARILRGLGATNVATVHYMPEPSRVVERAVEELASTSLPRGSEGTPGLRPVVLPGGGNAEDAGATVQAAAAMAELGVACVVTVGGDGTNGAVALGWPEVVVLPLPGGTNNAFAVPVDPTAAGLAAGLYATDPRRLANHVRPRPCLEVRVDGGAPLVALVDIALVRAGWVGAHAIWDPELLDAAVLARSDPSLTGLAGVGGMLMPLDGIVPRGLYIRFGGHGRVVLAPLGPGQLVPVAVRDWRILGLDEPAVLRDGRHEPDPPGVRTLAFDGERELVLRPRQRAEVRLTRRGPRVLDAAGLLRELAGRRLVATPDGRVGIAAPPRREPAGAPAVGDVQSGHQGTPS
jgi:hypothetical protein